MLRKFDDKHRTKGYALEFLLDRIEEDYGRMSFEGYFIFDADNLLKKDYITKMNDAFDSGEKIITSYRNTKNFDENWIAQHMHFTGLGQLDIIIEQEVSLDLQQTFKVRDFYLQMK